ncbi:hypothetical protein JYU29_07180 [Tianweitania sp. BSSL-BM11]|uniref:Uncharacterized protein n=1 Tax=Tianweitania aestuarii TaxID=2814886 RepID=A0ABS5RW94_9HYPH|nr:hypothetical protein [Tianweitania aestuarii]MBS9720464.1 hypothetical protein [Tianweitania aestuarii]
MARRVSKADPVLRVFSRIRIMLFLLASYQPAEAKAIALLFQAFSIRFAVGIAPAELVSGDDFLYKCLMIPSDRYF